MAKRGEETRTQILDAAEQLFLEFGYGGTTVEAILDRTGTTKGAFFHHFASKQALARALIERYAELDTVTLETNVARAERLSRDPLQQVLILIGLYEEAMTGLTEPFPGCLYASYCYQAGLFEGDVLGIVRESMIGWREVVGTKLRAAMAASPPRLEADPDELADAGLAVMEGAFILSKTIEEPHIVARQLRHYRNYLELLFGVVGADEAPAPEAA